MLARGGGGYSLAGGVSGDKDGIVKFREMRRTS